MFDFLTVKKEFIAKQQRYVYRPAFQIKPHIKDLFVRSRDFYALFNPETNMWVDDEASAITLIDGQVEDYVRKEVGDELLNDPEHGPIIKRLSDADSGLIDKFHKYCQQQLRDNYISLNQKVLFSNSTVDKKDYATYKLDYPLVESPTPYYDKLVNTLYLPDEREKFEYMVGCILAGDQSKIQKLFLFFGIPGSGKSTIINKVIVRNIFGGERSPYTTKFTAGLLVNKDSFGTEFLARDPVLAFDDDADLSRIDDNTTLNLIVSHEAVRVNSKFKATFTAYPNCILVCGTNEPVQLSPKSGMYRRLVDIRQTGEHLPPDQYDECIEHLPFERSGIAWRCLQVYKSKGKSYYNHYSPEDMLTMVNPFHNFVKDNVLELCDGTSLANAYKLYQNYCQECNYKTVITRYKFRDNLKLYFNEYDDKPDTSGKVIKNWFSGFKFERVGLSNPEVQSEPTVDIQPEVVKPWLNFNCTESLFDIHFKDQQAQYANEDGTPEKGWDYVKTTLKELDTHKLHYIRVPESLIVIDLDIHGEDGSKSYDKNYEAAIKFPPTYAELSKSGQGIHLHYFYSGGDPKELSRVYDDNVEIKVFSGKSALRRKLTKCNDIPIATIASGLPKKEETKMPNWNGFENEKHLRAIIWKALHKEIPAFPKTVQNVKYIATALGEAFSSGMSYDVHDLDPFVFQFACNSTNNADTCMALVPSMKFRSQDILDKLEDTDTLYEQDAPLVIFDCEVFPNLFIICWTLADQDADVVVMINPTPSEVEHLFTYKLIGFNNKKYDNYILWAASQGYRPIELFHLSQEIIVNHNLQAGSYQARNISYTDILDYASNVNKMSLKKWEIKLQREGKLVRHHENAYPWDQPVDKSHWDEIAEYCCDDVRATKEVWKATQADFKAREILSDLATVLNERS